jgi:hypothetical protein
MLIGITYCSIAAEDIILNNTNEEYKSLIKVTGQVALPRK